MAQSEVGYIFPEDAAKQVVEVGNAIQKTDTQLLKYTEDATKLINLLKEQNISFEQLQKVQQKAVETTKNLDAIGKQLIQSEEKLKQVEDVRLQSIIKNRLETQKATQDIKQKVRAQQAERGSIEQLSAVNAILEKRLKSVNLQTDEGRKKADLLRGAIDRNTKKIMDNSSAFSRWKINIGNYQSALEGLPGPLGDIATKASTVTQTLAKIGPIGAIVAGAIAALSAPLIAFFTKSEQGVEMLERKTAGFKAAWNVLVGEMISGGEKISDAFDKQTEQSTKWTKIMSLFGPTMTALGARMDLASTAAENYTRKQQELEDLERSMIVPRAKANQQIKEAMLLYQDQTKSISVRLSALQNAILLENQTADAEIEHQKSVVENIRIVNEEKRKAGLLRDEDDKKLQEAMAREIDLRTESAGRQVRATARINAARKELMTEEKTRQEEIKKRQTEEIAKQEELNRLKQSEIMLADLKLESVTTASVKSAESTQLEIDKLQELNDARTKAVKEQAEIEKEIAQNLQDAKYDIAAQGVDALFSLNAMRFEKELQGLEVEKAKRLDNEKLTQEQRAQIEAEYAVKEGQIKRKAAISDKAAALFQIALNTAMGVTNALSKVVTAPLVPFIIASGAIQAGLIAAQPIPKFAKGTEYAPNEFIAGESGREIVKTQSGDVYMAGKATHFKGNRFKGATVYTNKETEQIIKESGRNQSFVFDTKELKDEMKAVKNAIIKKPVMITDNSGRIVGKEINNYRETYLNRLRNGR